MFKTNIDLELYQTFTDIFETLHFVSDVSIIHMEIDELNREILDILIYV